VGASGGIVILWNSDVFSGAITQIKSYGIVINMTSLHNGESWTLVSVYGPCKGIQRDNFAHWLYNLHIPTHSNWLLIGDFNFIRSFDNRNKPGGDINDMLLFNEIIGHLGLLELPLKGRKYTWSNMQDQPLLEQLDWFFTSSNWIYVYPNSIVLPLAHTKSDHVPCVINIDTTIPKSNIFHFENYWVDQPGFTDCVKDSWNTPSHKLHLSAIITDKFKYLRQNLKNWQMTLSKLKLLIQKCNKVILIMDNLEEKRPLFLPEFNFRTIVKIHLEDLMLIECNY
jgi:hypothetical protein